MLARIADALHLETASLPCVAVSRRGQARLEIEGTGPSGGATEAPGAGYALERELGRGGMAVVYLAHDRKHDRRVAVKVLHADLAAVVGAERFLTEIRVTARLQHPHILGLIDSGVFGDEAAELRGRPFYVMPYVEGESLRGRLERDGQLPVADALRIAREVASALDYAHRHGVVHRDVKPENVLLGDDGQALVADFGIALAVQHAGGARLTQTGLSLGTPHYMSPEQAMGERQITARADVYALGAVTYEMLAGEPPFTAPTAQAVVARVLTEDPRSLTTQRRSVPPAVDAAVRRALEKLPADRFASAAEFAHALEVPPAPESAATTDSRNEAHAPVRHHGAGTRRTATALAAVAAMSAAVVGGVALGARTGWLGSVQDSPPMPGVRATLMPPPGELFAGGDGLALSPDGTQLAFTVLRAPPRPRLFVRTLASGVMRELAGTADAQFPFWSPDGRTLGFFAGGELRTVPLAGGLVTVVATAPAPRGGAWAPDGTLLFGGDPDGVIYRVRPGGGPPVAVTRTGPEGQHRLPVFLPDGHRFLYSGGRRTGIFVGDLQTGTHRRIRADGGEAAFAPPDRLLFAAAGTLAYGRVMEQHFDPSTGVADGEPTLVADSVFNPGGPVGYTVSGAGLLVYQQRPYLPQRVWLDRRGTPLDSVPDDEAWTFRLSHDGTRVAQGGRALWVRDLRRSVAMRVAAPGNAGQQVLTFPVWSPDDARLAFIAIGTESPVIFVVRADGTGERVRLPSPPNGGMPLDWSPDGGTLLLTGTASRTTGNQSLWLLDLATRAVTPWLAVAGSVTAARFSPDGRWVAYQSDETGAPVVYLRPFPGPGAPVRVSPAGGGQPAWRADGRELFYLTPDGDLMAATVPPSAPGRLPAVGDPRVLVRGVTHEPYSREVVPYDAAPDGQRFLLNAENRTAPPLTLLAPWWRALADSR
jgi:eukaryotic-like serine/threonine-protein kinase